jgi:hypothetical protein
MRRVYWREGILAEADAHEEHCRRTGLLTMAVDWALSEIPLPLPIVLPGCKAWHHALADFADDIWHRDEPGELLLIAQAALNAISVHQRKGSLSRTPEGSLALLNGLALTFLATGRLIASLRDGEECRALWTVDGPAEHR